MLFFSLFEEATKREKTNHDFFLITYGSSWTSKPKPCPVLWTINSENSEFSRVFNTALSSSWSDRPGLDISSPILFALRTVS